MDFLTWFYKLVGAIAIIWFSAGLGSSIAILINFGNPDAYPWIAVGAMAGILFGVVVAARAIYGVQLFPFL